MDIKELVKRFDNGVTEDYGHYCQKVCKPTKKSIQVINQYLGMEVPKSLIEFLRLSHTATSWFASFGEDFKNPVHVLQRNRRLRKIRRRVIGCRGKWEYVFPKNLVAFNFEFDGDNCCFDLSKYNKTTGEYKIVYWASPRIVGDEYDKGFPSFMKKE